MKSDVQDTTLNLVNMITIFETYGTVMNISVRNSHFIAGTSKQMFPFTRWLHLEMKEVTSGIFLGTSMLHMLEMPYYWHSFLWSLSNKYIFYTFFAWECRHQYVRHNLVLEATARIKPVSCTSFSHLVSIFRVNLLLNGSSLLCMLIVLCAFLLVHLMDKHIITVRHTPLIHPVGLHKIYISGYLHGWVCVSKNKNSKTLISYFPFVNFVCNSLTSMSINCI
jgi:hypothetical protein